MHTPSVAHSHMKFECMLLLSQPGNVSISSSRLEKFMKAEIDYFAQKAPQPVPRQRPRSAETDDGLGTCGCGIIGMGDEYYINMTRILSATCLNLGGW